MKCAYKHLIKHAIMCGKSIAVFSCEGKELNPTRNASEVVAMVENLDECSLRFFDDKGPAGTAYIIHDCDPDETVADFAMKDWLERWFDKFRKEGAV